MPIDRVKKAADKSAERRAIIDALAKHLEETLDRTPGRPRVKIFLDLDRKEWEITTTEHGGMHG